LARHRYPVVAGLVVAVVAADQATKTWALHHLGDHSIHVWWTLRLSLSFNSGIAFGLAQGFTPLLVGIVVVVVVALLGLGRSVTTPATAVALGLVLGGALGNLADRLLRHHGGAVIDFIDLGWWPVFNLADAAITCGAALLVLRGMRSRPA